MVVTNGILILNDNAKRVPRKDWRTQYISWIAKDAIWVWHGIIHSHYIVEGSYGVATLGKAHAPTLFCVAFEWGIQDIPYLNVCTRNMSLLDTKNEVWDYFGLEFTGNRHQAVPICVWPSWTKKRCVLG